MYSNEFMGVYKEQMRLMHIPDNECSQRLRAEK